MALSEKHVILFQTECKTLTSLVIRNLNKLLINADDQIALEEMLQIADTIIGDSRFINYHELEHASTLLVKTFNENSNLKSRSGELKFFVELFVKILNN